MAKYYLTKERFSELEIELAQLKTQKRIEIAEKLKIAKEYGDLSENAEYTEAKDEQAQLEVRIAELEEIMKHAVIIKKGGTHDVVRIGSTVTANKGEAMVQYQIVGSKETDPVKGKISNESPLGRAFLGRKVGDSVTIRTPSGSVAYQIAKVE